MPEGNRTSETKPEPKIEKAPPEKQTPEARAHPDSLPAQVLYHQRTIGNRAVQRLIASGSLGAPGSDIAASRRSTLEQEGSKSADQDLRDTPTPQPPAMRTSATPKTQTSQALKIDRAWYNVHIPFTDYELDPSLEGLKTAGNLAADKAKEGANWVKDTVAEMADAVVAKIKGVINSGVEWLTEKFNDIQAFAVSSFGDIKGALSSALGGITAPLSAITNAISAMDAGILSAAWRALTAGANAAWQAVKTVVNGVLAAGGGIFDAVSKFVDSLFGTVDTLLNSSAFSLLPGVVQAPIRSLYKTVHDLWNSIQTFWKDFWKRLTKFANDLLQSIQAFIQKVVSFAIDQVIETIRKLKEVYDFVKHFATDPESVLRPILNKIAAKIEAEAPGKAKEVAKQKMAEAAPGRPSPTSKTVVNRAPDGSAGVRSTTNRAVIDANINKSLSDQWTQLKHHIPDMLWDTVVKTFWPPATVRAIGHEFYELWETDWKNAASELFAPRSILDDFGGFWHDVWSNFLILLDFPLALWRRLNNILMLLMGYVTIILVLIGLVGGAIAGNVPGALAGAWAGAQLSWALGEALFASFLAAEAISALKAYLDLLTARQTEVAKERDYLQFAASTIGIGVAAAIALLFMLLGALAKAVVGRIKGGTEAIPKELPKGADAEGSKEEQKTEAETVPGKAALEAQIKATQTEAAQLRDTVKQTPRPAERAPLDTRTAEIQQKLSSLQEEAGRAANADDVNAGRQKLQDIRNELEAVRKDAKIAEVPGRATLQQDVAALKQRSATVRQRVEGLNANDQRALDSQLDAVDAELGRVEQAAQTVPTPEQVQRLGDALDKVRKSVDDIEHNPLLDLGLRGVVIEALKSLENIKKDPVGDINSELNKRGDPKNHYEAARREARGEVVARKANGQPFSHVGDLQRAFDGLENVRQALERESQHPSPAMTDRGLKVLFDKLSEVQGLMSRLRGFLDSIGEGNFPPYHTFPPGT